MVAERDASGLVSSVCALANAKAPNRRRISFHSRWRRRATAAPIDLFGTDYDTADGTCVRDYVHVMDIADAYVRALSYLLESNPSCAFNLANAQGYSVRQVTDLAQSVAGRPIYVNAAARRPATRPS